MILSVLTLIMCLSYSYQNENKIKERVVRNELKAGLKTFNYLSIIRIDWSYFEILNKLNCSIIYVMSQKPTIHAKTCI